MEIARYFGKNRKFFLCGDRLQNTYFQCCVEQSPGSSHKARQYCSASGWDPLGLTRFPYSKCLKMWFVSWSTELIEGAVACADVSGADLVSGSLTQRGGSIEMGKVWHGRWWQGAIQPVQPCNGGEIIQFRGSEVVFLIHSKMMQESST